jgi:DNA polymerase-3 subunit epsilon
VLLTALDCETTGINVFEDRIVTVFAGVLDTETGTWNDSLNLLVNPGIDIPEGASAIHGITTRVARSFGVPTVKALWDVDQFIGRNEELPVVIMNANYDLSLLNAEYERNGMDFFYYDEIKIVDPLVIDRHHDKYRKGSRKLVDLAKHYGVPVDESEAHDAAYDCYLAGSVAAIQIERYGMPTNAEQAQWFEEWRSGFESYLKRTNPTASVEAGWPTRVKEEEEA